MVPAANNMNSVFYAENYHPIQVGSIDGTDTAPHDNAVYRAMIASSTGLYDPIGDPKAEGEPYCTVFVGRLSRNTTEETLFEAMSKYGRVKSLRLVRHIVTGASRGYAFVEYETEKEMRRAFEVAHNSIIDGNEVMVDYNRQQLMPGWIPGRLGGGLGGRKESGQLRFGGRDRPFRAPLRPIPREDLKKLGIPLPPEGRYLSRFQLPPLPKRRSGSPVGNYPRQGSHQHHISLHHLELILQETSVTSETADLNSDPKHSHTSKKASSTIAAPVLKGDLQSIAFLEAEKTMPENVKGVDYKRHRSRQEGKRKEDTVLEKEQRILYSQQSRHQHHLSRSSICEKSK